MAPQLTGTNGPSRRGPDSWMSFATNSLPVPDSPQMCTGAWLRATRAIISRRCCMAAELPSRRGPNTLVSPSLGVRQLDGGGDQFAQTRQISGLETKSKAPSLSARTAVSMLPCAVITATGTLGEYCCIHFTRSSPSPSGSCMSVRHRSKRSVLSRRCAAADAAGGARTQGPCAPR